MSIHPHLQPMQTYSHALLRYLQQVKPSVWRHLVMAACLLWMVHNLARSFWFVMPQAQIDRPALVVAQKVGASVQASSYQVDLAALQARQIFGAYEDEAVQEENEVKPVVEENVSKTRLNLKLVGLLMSDEPVLSSATIAKGNKQDIYQIDDALPAGNEVSLAKVLHDRVILNNNGTFEALWLYAEDDFSVQSSVRRTISRPISSNVAPAGPQIERRVSRSDIPQSLTDAVRFNVHRDGGKVVGFRVRPGRNRDFFDKLGLESGDVVKSVNGIRLDSPQAIRDNYRRLKDTTSADLEIQRGTETLVLTISLDSISE